MNLIVSAVSGFLILIVVSDLLLICPSDRGLKETFGLAIVILLRTDAVPWVSQAANR